MTELEVSIPENTALPTNIANSVELHAMRSENPNEIVNQTTNGGVVCADDCISKGDDMKAAVVDGGIGDDEDNSQSESTVDTGENQPGTTTTTVSLANIGGKSPSDSLASSGPASTKGNPLNAVNKISPVMCQTVNDKLDAKTHEITHNSTQKIKDTIGDVITATITASITSSINTVNAANDIAPNINKIITNASNTSKIKADDDSHVAGKDNKTDASTAKTDNDAGIKATGTTITTTNKSNLSNTVKNNNTNSTDINNSSNVDTIENNNLPAAAAANNNTNNPSVSSVKDIHATTKANSLAETEVVKDNCVQLKKKIDNLSSDDSNEMTDLQDPLMISQNVEINDISMLKMNNQQDNNIVDLVDDSDLEMSVPPPAKITENNAIKQEKANADSDVAVIIGSDSENESSYPPYKNNNNMATKMAQNTNTKMYSQLYNDVDDDDDDDDCVVIEDDTPAAPTDLSKRKTMHLDNCGSLDDFQPPFKRQRGAPMMMNNNIRNQMSGGPIDMSKRRSDVGIHPVNISCATNSNLMGSAGGPPKLVPVGSPLSSANSLFPLTGLPIMNSNANLLPGLTDDMYVLEAPSFIVPYIYEKPPLDNIGEVLKELENRFSITKDDLVEIDKTDEFDMMTEQNKEDRDDKHNKKKKRRRGDDGDDSWSEDSIEEDDDDDDDDSETGVRTKVLIKEASDDITALKSAIKPASAVTQSIVSQPQSAAKLGQENYFESPLGKFFMDIGVGLVQEHVQSDLIRLQKRKMRKCLGRNVTEFERAIAALTSNLEASKKKNLPFKFHMKRCEFCNFKSESALAMANHYETPHMNGALYKCNFCIFEIRNATEIVYHMEAVHNIKARLIKPLPYHQCANCGFEDNGKAKLARHLPVCAKKFRPEINLAPPSDWEAPGKIPRIKPRHGLVGTATAYQAMAAQAAAQKAALATIQQQQQARNMQAVQNLAVQNATNKLRGRSPQILVKPSGPATANMIRNPNQNRSSATPTVIMPNSYQMTGGGGGQMQMQTNTVNKKTLSGQPSISITPLPRQNAANASSVCNNISPSSSKMPPSSGMKPGQIPAGGNSKAQFVICEICDGYIKDLEQLRNHLQWMHKVKIHPKMIYQRPPLNCQKCQFRFFSDQGLERHLLGSHGLVTSSMQEAANKGKDGGRCPVCGRMYQWKLLNHVSRDHHMTLKPAHLSYKCTVCTATFGMYKQFETHVYSTHCAVAKKAIDGKKTSSISNTTNTASGSNNNQRNSLNATSDSLLKPLKINDEITIIPQLASKSRVTRMDTHVID